MRLTIFSFFFNLLHIVHSSVTTTDCSALCHKPVKAVNLTPVLFYQFCWLTTNLKFSYLTIGLKIQGHRFGSQRSPRNLRCPASSSIAAMANIWNSSKSRSWNANVWQQLFQDKFVYLFPEPSKVFFWKSQVSLSRCQFYTWSPDTSNSLNKFFAAAFLKLNRKANASNSSADTSPGK